MTIFNKAYMPNFRHPNAIIPVTLYSAEYTSRRKHQKSRGAPVFRSNYLNQNDVGRLRDIPELAVSFLMRANQAILRTQLTEIKCVLVILDLTL